MAYFSHDITFNRKTKEKMYSYFLNKFEFHIDTYEIPIYNSSIDNDRCIYITKFDNCNLKIILTPNFISIDVILNEKNTIHYYENLNNHYIEYELNKIILENLGKKYDNFSCDFLYDEKYCFNFTDTIVPYKTIYVQFNKQNIEKNKKNILNFNSDEIFELLNIKLYKINHMLYIENTNTCDYYDISHTDYQNFIEYLKTTLQLSFI
jgi:hypothetical protein